MSEIAKRTTLGALLLLLMPAGVWIFGWQWQPAESGFGLKVLFWLTETVTSPWGIATSIILCAWFLWCLRYRFVPALILLLVVITALASGQYVKSFIKDQVQEPRPYVKWLEKTQGMDAEAFYALKRKQRSALLDTRIRHMTQLPDWQKKHWLFETGYAFPSGHTMFAVSWALLAVGLLWPRRRRLTVVLMFIWAVGVMGSRLKLGMHWPQDLMASTIISWLLVTLAVWLVQRWCGSLTVAGEEQQEIQMRE